MVPYALKATTQHTVTQATPYCASQASSRTLRLSSLLTGSMIPGEHHLPEDFVLVGRLLQPSARYARSRARPSSCCPAAIRCSAALSAFQIRFVVSPPRCSISRDPSREDHTICTSVAPDVAFTVRMYGMRPLYSPRLVRKSSFNELETRRLAICDTGHSQKVAQLRS